MKKLFILLIIGSFLASSCVKDLGEPYTLFRTVNKQILLTQNGAYLYMSALTDKVYEIEVYNAKVETKMYNISDTTILQYGHIWSLTDSLPVLGNPSFYSSFIDTVNKEYFDTTPYISKLTGLKMDTFYYVRSYVITRSDTGYNQVSTRFKTKIPENVWFQKSDFSGISRTDAVSFNVGTNAYIATGFDGINLLDDIWQYNITADTWTQIASVPGNNAKRRDAVAFVIDTDVFIGTGNSATATVEISPLEKPKPQRNFVVFHTTTNTFGWGGRQPDSMPDWERHKAIAFSIGRKGYVGLGTRTNPVNDVWEYTLDADTSGNPGYAWRIVANFPGGRRTEAVAAVLAGKAYIGTGLDENGNYKNDLYSFHPVDGWASIGFMPEGTARANGVAFSLSYAKKSVNYNMIFVGTGRNATTLLNDFYAFDIEQRQWKRIADCGTVGREGAVSFTIVRDDEFDIDRRGMVALGQGAVKLKDVWEYLP